MKKLLILLASLAMLAGCEKTTIQKAEETYRVNFDVNIQSLLDEHGMTYNDLTISIDALEYDEDKLLVNTQKWIDVRQGKSHTFTADKKSKYYVLHMICDFKIAKYVRYVAKVFYVGTDEEVTLRDNTLMMAGNPID